MGSYRSEVDSYRSEVDSCGESLGTGARGIAELIAHARLKSFPQALAAFLYGCCPYTELALWVKREGRASLLLHSDGDGEEGSEWQRCPDLVCQPESRKEEEWSQYKVGVFCYSGEPEQRVNGLLPNFDNKGYQDRVAIGVEVAEKTRLLISLGRKPAWGEMTRKELRRLQELFAVLDALLQQYWSAQGEILVSDGNGNPLESALSSFGQGILTRREQQVSSMILQGHSSRVIACELNISIGTVKVHRKNIHNRMRIRSQRDLFHAFLSHFYSQVIGPGGA